MGSKDSPRCTLRTSTLEPLEHRVVMSADPLVGGATPTQTLTAEDLVDHGGLVSSLSAVSRSAYHDADFWIDASYERDLDFTLGDVEKSLASAHGVTGLTRVRNDYGFTGAGQTVAIIDSGIAWDHTALGGGFGPDYRVVGGWDFTEENDDNPYDDGPAGAHGTHVAGIVGASKPGLKDTGVAPGVDLVGLRVFNDAGAGYFSWVESALRWVHENRNVFANPITTVNMSLGTSWNADSVPNWSTIEDELAQLKADGIFISVAAGNSFGTTYSAPGLSYPAASPSVVPVMSIDDGGQLSSFSQRHSRAIAAPGRYIVSTVPDYVGNHNHRPDDFASFSGTSMAAPYVAGASVLVREAMQFVGDTYITQDTIYNHLMATADRVLDAATGLSFKRLNLASALDALMPADDYGSTSATAHELGTLGATGVAAAGAAPSGVIGKLDDVDCFRFTAAVTGTVSFSTVASGRFDPVWHVGESTSRNHMLTLDVVAGQSYCVGISSVGGIGHYQLTIDVESTLTYVDWGSVAQSYMRDVAGGGESWYRIEATRTGLLTVEALFDNTGGEVDLQLFDGARRQVASGHDVAEGARVDFAVAAGSEYFLRVNGTNSDIGFRLTNLVSSSGTTVRVAGTRESDAFEFVAGTEQHTLRVNGVSYQFGATTSRMFEFAGGDGNDAIALTGTDDSETANLRVGGSTIAGKHYAASAIDIESVSIDGGGEADVARFYDTAGNDVFRATPTQATMAGTNYAHTAFNFARTMAWSAGVGQDLAYLHDGASNDKLFARPDYTVLQAASNEFYNYAAGFDRVSVYATAGGADDAYLYGGATNDRLIARPDYVTLFSLSGEFDNFAAGFDRTFAYATSGGSDDAYLYDSAGNDRFVAHPHYASLYGMDTGYYNYANGFARVFAYASTGSDDAFLYDAPTNDRLVTRPQYAVLQSVTGEFYNYANGFDRAFAYATAGGSDDAYFYDGAGNDRYVARPEFASMYDAALSYYNYASQFERTFAHATAGGINEALFFDGSSNDRFVARPDYVLLQGLNNEFYNYAAGFDAVHASASSGEDVACLFGSTDYRLVVGQTAIGNRTGVDRRNTLAGFDDIVADVVEADGRIPEHATLDYLFEKLGHQV